MGSAAKAIAPMAISASTRRTSVAFISLPSTPIEWPRYSPELEFRGRHPPGQALCPNPRLCYSFGLHLPTFQIGMRSRRYTFVIADRQTGAVRRLTISLWPTLAAVMLAFALPVLIGLGARWSASATIGDLQTSNAALQVENASYREATGQLAGQIAELQA